MKFVVASASPRRHELLRGLGLAFEVTPADIDEAAAAGARPPDEAVLTVALAKAAIVSRADALVLAADTIVVLDGEVLGKPASPADARRMLEGLRGRSHRVLTAVCVASAGRERTAVVESEVRLRRYAPAEIDAYVAAGGGLDKAGAYGIQDEPFQPVDAIAGCWCNVMGLPLWTTWDLLVAANLPVPRTPARAFARCAECPLGREVA